MDSHAETYTHMLGLMQTHIYMDGVLCTHSIATFLARLGRADLLDHQSPVKGVPE